MGAALHVPGDRLKQLASRVRGLVRPVRKVLYLGIGIRVALAFFSAHAGDQFTFAAIALGQVYGSGPYAIPNIYPPGWDLILGGIGRFDAYLIPPSQLLFPTAMNTAVFNVIGPWEPFYFVSPVFVFSEKLVLIFFDCATGLLLYLLARNGKIAGIDPRFVFAFWMFNPLVLWESAVHGDYDVVPTFFVVLSLSFVQSRRPGWAGLSLGLSAILKLYALFIIPLFLILSLRARGSNRNGAPSRSAWTAAFFLGLLLPPLAVFWSPGLLQQYYVYAFTGPAVGVSFGGFWIWSFTSLYSMQSVATWLTSHSEVITLVSFIVGGGLAVLIGTLPLWSRRLRGRDLLESSTLLACGVCGSYFANPVVQPQYLIWIIPYMVLWASVKRSMLVLALLASSLAVLVDNLEVGPLYYWQSLTYYFGTPSQSLLVSSSRFFYQQEVLSYPLTFIPGFVVIVLFIGLALREHLRAPEAADAPA